MSVRYKLKRMIMYLFFMFVLVILIVLICLSARDRQVIFDKEKSFDSVGTERTYLISYPSSFTQESKLIIGLHGLGDSPRRLAYYTGLHNAVGKNDIVLYPKALKPTSKSQKSGWNSGYCCGSGWINNTDDVTFITNLAQMIISQNGIRANNVYVTGFSNGAFMSQRLAIERPDTYRAVAVRSGSIGTTKSRLLPTRPVPILLMHGLKDKTVPYEGGVGVSDPDFDWLTFEEMLATWQTVNEDNVPTKKIIHPNDSHGWHDWRIFNFWHRTPQGSKDVMDFFNSL